MSTNEKTNIKVIKLDKDIEVIEADKVDVLMQSRDLVHVSYDVTTVQNRLFYYFLLKAQKQKSSNMTCEVHLNDLKKLIPRTNQATLSNIKKMINSLQSTRILFEYYKNGEKVESDYVLIAGFDYHTETQMFTITILEIVYKRLLDYTIYAPLNLDILTKFQSFYSQRLYELLRLWSRTDKIVIKRFKVSQIRFLLGVGDKYASYKNFKQRVLSQALKEINELGNMQVKILQEIRAGRKVDEVEFEILDFEKKRYFKDLVEIIPPPDNDNPDDKSNDDSDKSNDNTNNEDNSDIDFYVPNEAFFTEKTLDTLKVDFYNIDFKDKHMKKLLEASIFATLEYTSSKDSVTSTKIVQKNYNYFKTTLLNKIKNFKDGKYSDDIPKIKTRFHNIGSSFEKYEPDELENLLNESQKDKFKTKKEDKEKEPTISKDLLKDLANKYLLVMQGEGIFKDELVYNYNFNVLISEYEDKSVKEVLELADKYNIEYELDTLTNEYVNKK